MTEQSDVARLDEIRQRWEKATPFERELHLAAWEEDIAWLIALASRAVEQQRGRDADSIENVQVILASRAAEAQGYLAGMNAATKAIRTGPLTAAYGNVLTRIEGLEKKLAIAVNAAGVEDARATAAEQEVVKLRGAIVAWAAHEDDHTRGDIGRDECNASGCWAGSQLRAIAAEGNS